MHADDPIAYCLNAAVDRRLAESLKVASVPSSSTSFLQSIGNVLRWSSSSSRPSFGSPVSTAVEGRRPSAEHPTTSTVTPRLPSNVELETHNFTREEIAEKRMALLNDNGQIDYFLPGGAGPLNIQYLNMLNAHGSYWWMKDFVRFFVVEIARKQGKRETLLPFRAQKKKGWKAG